MVSKPAVSDISPKSFLSFTDMLLKKDVRLVDQGRLLLACDRCGSEWRLRLSPRSQLLKGYGRCPQGCHINDLDETGMKS